MRRIATPQPDSSPHPAVPRITSEDASVQGPGLPRGPCAVPGIGRPACEAGPAARPPPRTAPSTAPVRAGGAGPAARSPTGAARPGRSARRSACPTPGRSRAAGTAQREDEVDPYPGRQVPQPVLHRPGLGQDVIDKFERQVSGQLTEMARGEHSSGDRDGMRDRGGGRLSAQRDSAEWERARPGDHCGSIAACLQAS
jgi:hypothetical protein